MNKTGEHCSPLPIFLRITKKFVKKIENVEVQKKRGVRFLQNKKSLMSGTSISVSLRAEISPLPYKKRPHLG
ncbi:hypothetical protein, partial [Ruminococcus bicirculans (ex Wegman et al. 2014)]|uniref:hypothetical protein n=1 Tax=Ruminococcus bicirculans (ex Wegman et al. 2014) TaxID=1160721 RepID=UPI0036716ED4